MLAGVPTYWVVVRFLCGFVCCKKSIVWPADSLLAHVITALFHRLSNRLWQSSFVDLSCTFVTMWTTYLHSSYCHHFLFLFSVSLKLPLSFSRTFKVDRTRCFSPGIPVLLVGFVLLDMAKNYFCLWEVIWFLVSAFASEPVCSISWTHNSMCCVFRWVNYWNCLVFVV